MDDVAAAAGVGKGTLVPAVRRQGRSGGSTAGPARARAPAAHPERSTAAWPRRRTRR
ncbi:MAG: hypothetical protein WKF83_06010 [Nocardioidaceae bacterium]